MYNILQGKIMEEEPNPDIRPSVEIEPDDDDPPRRQICIDHLGQPLYDDEIPTGNEESFKRDCRDAEYPKRLTHWLKFMRKRFGTSKECVAMQMGKSLRDITVMEKGEDSDLRFVDVARYLEAIGVDSRLRFSDVMLEPEEEERRLILDAARSLNELRGVLQKREDARMLAALDRFLGGTLTSLLLRAHDSETPSHEIFVSGVHIEPYPFIYR